MSSSALSPILPVFVVASWLVGCRSDKPADDTSAPLPSTTDADGDGYDSDEECDDSDGSVNPGAPEVCDGIDNNCDGEADEGATSPFYADDDGDGFGDPGAEVEACEAPAGHVAIPNDCDDGDAEIYPGAAERCDDTDNDCDGTADEEVLTEWFADADEDGYGDPSSAYAVCDPPPGYVDNADDCDDTDETALPGGVEVCDEADNDCDGVTDEEVTTTFYADTDGDSYGVADATTESCDRPTGYAAEPGDCDDADRAIHPAALELCDAVDNDCDGAADEDDAADASTWYVDADGDSYGVADTTADACAAPVGYVDNTDDCDDSDADIRPGGAEVCDDEDNDCDGDTDEASASDAATWYADSDGDGYGGGTTARACDQPTGYAGLGGDCDDGDTGTFPGGAETCDGDDNDCDGTTDEGVTTTFYADSDGDGHGDPAASAAACSAPGGYVSRSTDCDDTDATISPNAAELCDGDDNDCDGTADEASAADASTWYYDGDGDSYGVADTTADACEAPAGYVDNTDDCDDSDADIRPGEEEVCDEVDNDCDGTADEDDAADASSWYHDGDSDGYGDAGDAEVGCGPPAGYIEDGEDCDDAEAEVNPSAAEVADGLDNDCDGEGLDGGYAPTSDAALAGGTWEFTDFTIDAGVVVTVTGASPLEILVLGAVDISGTLDLSGEDGDNHGPYTTVSGAYRGGAGGGGGGADGGDGACYNCGYSGKNGSGAGAGGGGSSSGVGGGGGGGGQGTEGEDGSAGVCTSARCGSSYTVAGGIGGAARAGSAPELLAGSGGGGGGYGVADNGDGGGGGGGGGALYLQAESIDISGEVDCSGGRGGSDLSGYDGGSGGGGSGGTLWLAAGSLYISGVLDCTGGAGGTTVIGGTNAQGGFGGDGGDGVIWLDVASPSVTGSVDPAWLAVP